MPSPIGRTLRGVYEARAGHVAVADDRGARTYGELESRARRLATGLLGLGGRAGDRVLIVSPNCCEWVEVDHALFIAGLVRVCALTRLHPLEVRRMAEDCEPYVLIADAEWLEAAGRDWIPDAVTRVVTIGGDGAAAMDYEELVAQADEAALPEPDPDAVAWIAYTSGSTGLPKGVTFTQRTIGAMMRNLGLEMAMVGPDDVAVHTAPLSHFSGTIAYELFIKGATNLLHRDFDVNRLIDTLEEGRVTVLPLVPTQITILTEELRRRADAGRPADVRGIKVVPYAGSAIAPDRAALAQALLGPVMMQFYGASEAPMPLTALHPDQHLADGADGRLPRLASAGRPNANVELKIIGARGETLPQGETGEIAARGDNITPGYWQQPDATAEVLDDQGWLRTGDVGYFDEHGFLFIVDRKKDMIVTGGFNVFPREVENAISTMDGVREVAVVAAPSAQWGEQIVAVVALTPGAELTPADVIEYCRGLIGRFKIPKEVRLVDELPKSATGKIDKRSIREELWAGHGRRV